VSDTPEHTFARSNDEYSDFILEMNAMIDGDLTRAYYSDV
jgi:hypothetical protein